MTKSEQAVKDIHITDDAGAGKDRVHPLSRLLVTFFYILAVVSFHKYNLAGLLGMALYILVQCIWNEISAKAMLRRIWPVLVLAGMAGIANPVLDKNEYMAFDNFRITYGMVSMATLMIKSVFCVMAAYILVMETGVIKLCYALRVLRVPKEMITVLLLMHRYMIVLVQEAERMQQAYKLRAPKQKGLHIRAWGSFAGLLLLRSIDRAQEVYESMKLRGFDGTMRYSAIKGSRRTSILYVAVWGIGILIFRMFPVFQIAGRILTSF